VQRTITWLYVNILRNLALYICSEMKEDQYYHSPELEMCELLAEGILCSSGGNEGVGEEEGNGGFN
jgi:hypothetical protein